MKTQVTGTVVDGELQLDQPLEFPDQSRVSIIVESVATNATDWEAAMEKFKQLRQRYRIRTGGRRFTRQELHERR